MNRRDLLVTGAAAAATHALMNLGCGSTTGQAEQPAGPASSGGEAPPVATTARATLAQAASSCVAAGEACLTHCLTRFSAGDTSMAACATAVRSMLAVCRATADLATTSSAHLAALARVCASVCADCAEACTPHAGHHPECGACLEACRSAERAAAAVTA